MLSLLRAPGATGHLASRRPSRARLFSAAPVVLAAVTSALAAATSAGCYGTGNDCNLFNCGTGAGTPEECIPKEAPGPVADGCGVFVAASGDDAGLGTKASPAKTLAAAIQKAKEKSRRVYACAETFTEPLTVDTDVTIFGGLDCKKDWAYSATTRTTWTAPADQIPVRVAAGVSLATADLDILAADATTPGGSSVALIAGSMASLDFTRAAITAGVGVDGAFGQPFGAFANDGAKGSTGVDACLAMQSVTPDAPVNRCGDVDSVGGSGGLGSSAQGSAGNPGEPAGDQNGGAGETGATPCKAGTAGVAGMDGSPGAGAKGTGTIDENGYTGVPGSAGSPGTPGQGGGGGGGSKGGSGAGKCPDANKAAGASGGSGGSGGCGGQGGNGGGAGGSSMAILSLGAQFKFDEVTLTAKSGGAGGAGGDGQGGGVGGGAGTGGKVPMGAMLAPGCPGGPGGAGGAGGKGGGGLGGHSVAIAHVGVAPDTAGATLFVASAGEGGIGDGANDSTNGEKGVAADTLGF